MKEDKPLKVQDVGRRKRFGIVVRSFKDLLLKACQKLEIKEVDSVRMCLEEDGTIVDQHYFQHIKPFTALIVLKQGESWQGYYSLLFVAMEKLWLSSEEAQISRMLQEFMMQDRERKYEVLRNTVESMKDSDKAALESRQEHPDWFQGVEKRFKSKESVMAESARRRIRHYLFKSKEQLLSTSEGRCSSRRRVQEICSRFYEHLKSNNFNGNYFCRGSPLPSYCDTDGSFLCQGSFDVEKCSTCHSINPYSSNESRILFSTWNLDHVIERSRQILPDLAGAVDSCPPGRDINWSYFYALLFTRSNLKLVHIACHRKDAHTNCVTDKSQYYTLPTT